MSVAQCPSYLDYQIINDLTRVRKLIRSIESSDPKLLAATDKADAGEYLKSYFEAILACILLCDPESNNKAYSNKNEMCSVPDTGVLPMVGGRDQETKLALRV